MPMDIEQTAKELRGRIAGEVQTNSFTRELYSRDASIFEIQPSIVVFPKVVKDVEEIVRFVHEKKSAGQDISLSARAAGTDMTGGSLTSSIMVVFTKYLNQVQVFEDYAVTQLGAYYRDFEKETLKHDLILPSYPVSRNIAAMGGIINNNSGGERTLMYGQTDRYVEELHVVLSDGSTALFHPLDAAQLE
ncbi:MAG TPA: FAD-binding oxidoreductase, partial [Candidatus Paceibacterota bacterium]